MSICLNCGHEHKGVAWAYICIGCPCPATPGKPEPVAASSAPAETRPGVCIHGGLRRQCETCDLADRLEVAEAQVSAQHAQLCTLMDAAGERDSIAALLADREEMTVYLKVAALQAERDALTAERERLTAAVQSAVAVLECLPIKDKVAHVALQLRAALAPQETK